MNRIHVIERLRHIERVPNTENEWESRWWKMIESKAKKLVGGEIHFHKKKKEPSFFGGIILEYRVEQHGTYAGRLIFRFRHEPDFRGVPPPPKGWSLEKNVILDDE